MKLAKEFTCKITKRKYKRVDKIKGWNLYDVEGVYMVFKDQIVDPVPWDNLEKPYYPRDPNGVSEWQYTSLRSAKLKLKIVSE